MLNLQKEMEKIIVDLNYKPKLLLHCCCAPCASYVVEYLKQYFKITLLYYNPNIAPIAEYELRLAETKRLAEFFCVEFVSLNWDNEIFMQNSKGLEKIKEGGERCTKCFKLRLQKTAEFAKQNEFDYFTTALSISPLKNSQKLYEIGSAIGENLGVRYLPSDFKKKNGYKRSVELSKELDLYRQNYCGCVFSKSESLSN